MPERRHLIASAIVVLLLALLPLAGSRYAVDLATEVLIYVLFALSLNVLIGFTGNISFGHAAYFAIGGYACAILLTTYGWPLAFALPAAVVLAGLVAAVVGLLLRAADADLLRHADARLRHAGVGRRLQVEGSHRRRRRLHRHQAAGDARPITSATSTSPWPWWRRASRRSG